MKTLRITILGAVFILSSAGCEPVSDQNKEIAEQNDAISFPSKFAGNITTSGAVRSDFATYWNQITPENEGKWGSVQPSQGTWNWTALDAIYQYAQSNNIVFKEHTFVWGSQQPSWVNSSNAASAVQAWMNAFCARYPNTKLIDVVNEPPPHTTPSYIDGMGGTGSTGYDWIVNAFKWARAACPNAVLILNDYNTIEYSGDNSHFIDIVNKIKAAGAPIDAIGAQAHAAYGISTSTVKSYIDNLAATGLPVYITEYDINLADDTQQKNVMQDQFTMFWTHGSVKGVTLWGYVYGSTWLPYTGLIRTDGSLRPAMTWLMSYLNGGSGGGPIADGTYKIVARHSGKALDAYANQTANGTQIIQWSYGGGSNQKWTVTDTGGGKYKIIGVQSGKSLDIYNGASSNGTKVELWDYSGGSMQTFTFTATDSGYYRITPENATSSCLDVSGASTEDGAAVELWTYSGGANQQWIFQTP